VPAPSDAPTKEIVNLSFSDPFSWLASGWRDMLVLVLIVLELLWGLLVTSLVAVARQLSCYPVQLQSEAVRGIRQRALARHP
jgi:hypothetical protein